MALDLDAFAVLRAIAAHPAAFPEIKIHVVKATSVLATKLRTLVVKQLKSKTADLSSVKDIRKALGAEIFNLIVDGMKDAEVKTVVNRLDKNHPNAKTANLEWRRRQLRALADGSIEPTHKVKKAKPQYLNDASAGAVRKR